MNNLVSCIFLFVLSISCTKLTDTSLVLTNHESDFDTTKGILSHAGQPYSGEILEHFPDSTLKSKRFYSQGLLHGKELYWYSNGQIATSRFYELGTKIDTHKGWYSNGQEKFIYPINDKGQYQGEVKEWYQSGQQYKSFNYESGKERGSQKLWKSDGRIKANYVIKNGERYGLMGLKRCITVKGDSTKLKK
ncbi:MAG: antitoxin component YwqK of YwqJK toxin-antitoxin module [Glaciecola sp.]|jgi:antitoxin component YwqK of YwqJK toxin-antitoxin module